MQRARSCSENKALSFIRSIYESKAFFYKSEMPNYVLGLQVVELVSRTNP
jgi:hypothetical protein